MEVNENTVPDVAFGNPVTATDPDSGATLTYSLSGADAASFAIVESSGQLKTKATLDYEAKSSYSVEVRVDDRFVVKSIAVTNRPWDTRVGTPDMRIPQVREDSSFPCLPEPRRRSEHALLAVVQQAYVEGVSTRRVEDLVQALGCEGISKSQVSRICKSACHTGHGRSPLEPLHKVHPYLPSDGSHRRSGACSQSDISDSRQPTARPLRRSGGGKVPSATFL